MKNRKGMIKIFGYKIITKEQYKEYSEMKERLAKIEERFAEFESKMIQQFNGSVNRKGLPKLENVLENLNLSRDEEEQSHEKAKRIADLDDENMKNILSWEV